MCLDLVGGCGVDLGAVGVPGSDFDFVFGSGLGVGEDRSPKEGLACLGLGLGVDDAGPHAALFVVGSWDTVT